MITRNHVDLRRARPVLAAMLGAAILLVTGTAAAAVPVTIATQGTLRASNGPPAADGVYKLTFALYAKKADAKAVWSEGPVPLEVKAGVFSHVLGSLKPLNAATVGNLGGGWLGVKIGDNSELPRRALHSVAFAMSAASADKLRCSGCVTGAHLANASLAAKHVGFNYAAAKTKGGPASSALDLQCSGCVSVKELAFDGDIDLKSHTFRAAKVTADAVVAKTISAASYIGDGSKLTGIKSASGTCTKAGEVVRGIKPDGSLICVKAMDPSALPADGLDEVSNKLLSNQFIDEFASKKTPLPIQDNNPTGTPDTLDFPDIGIAQKLTVKVHVTTSDLAQLSLTLFGPDNSKYVLLDKGKTGAGAKSGKLYKGAWPAPDKAVSGDLTGWIGKNPKGKWRLVATDHKFLNNKSDGRIESWSVGIQTLSNKKVHAAGRLIAGAGITFAKATVPCDAAHAGTISWDGKYLQVCTGKKRYPIIVGTPGTSENPAASCQHIRTADPTAADGDYWIDPDGGGGIAAFKVRCLMSRGGGGWTEVSNFEGVTFNNLSVTQRNSLKWTTVRLEEHDHASGIGKFSKLVSSQACYKSAKSGFQTTSGGTHCDTGIQVRIGGPGGSCNGSADGCFGIYKGSLNKPWGCNWSCSGGAVTVWGKGYNCSGCKCRNAPWTTTAGCGNGGGKGAWGKLRFHMYVR